MRYELFCADNTFSLFYLECTQLLYPEVQAIWYGAAGENFDIFMLEIPSEKRFGASKPNKNRLRRLLSSKKVKKTNLGLEPSWGLDLGFQRRRRNSYVNPNSVEPRP